MVSFLEFGSNKVMESKVAHLQASGNESQITGYFNAAFYFQLVISLIALPLFYFMVDSGMEKGLFPYQNMIIALFALVAALRIFRSLLAAMLIASRKMHMDNRLQIINNIFNYVLVLLLVPFLGVLGMAIVSLVMVVSIVLRTRKSVWKLYPYLELSKRGFRSTELKDILSTGMYFSLGSVATILLLKMDTYVIGRYISFSEVTAFVITIKAFVLFQKLIGVFLNNYRPFIAHYFGKKDWEILRKFYSSSSAFTLGLALVGVGTIGVLNPYFIDMWVGQQHYLGSEVSLVFGCYILVDLAMLPYRIILTSSLYRIKEQAFSHFLQALLRLGLIVLMLESMSTLSLPASILISAIVVQVTFFTIQLNRFFREKGESIKQRNVLVLLLVLILFGVLMYLGLGYMSSYLFMFIGVIYILLRFISRKDELLILLNIR